MKTSNSQALYHIWSLYNTILRTIYTNRPVIPCRSALVGNLSCIPQIPNHCQQQPLGHAPRTSHGHMTRSCPADHGAPVDENHFSPPLHHKTLTREQSRTGGSSVAWRRRSVFRSAALTSCSWEPCWCHMTQRAAEAEGRKEESGQQDGRTSSCRWRRAPRRNTGETAADRDEMLGSLAGYTQWVVTRAEERRWGRVLCSRTLVNFGEV